MRILVVEMPPEQLPKILVHVFFSIAAPDDAGGATWGSATEATAHATDAATASFPS